MAEVTTATQSDTPFVGVQAIFTSSDYSDLTVLCGTEKYLVHRDILCPRSQYFREACNGVLKVTLTPAAKI